MRTWSGFLLCFLLGCSSSRSDATTGGDDTGTSVDTAATTDATDEVAESGPACGTNVGDVLCDLDLQGYERDAVDGLATSGTLGKFKTSEVLAVGKQRYAFIFNTAYW